MAASNDHQWHPVSPLAMIHHALVFMRQLVGSNPGPMLGILAGGYAFAQRSPVMTIATVIGLAIGGLCLVILAWLRFRYRILDHAIQVRQGIFKRQNLSLEFTRIQNVRIETPLYLRPFGLARLSIESAGSASEEVQLPGIPAERARGLRNMALARSQAESDPESDSPSKSLEAGELLLTRKPSDLVIYGISSPAILWGGAILAPIMGAVMQRMEGDGERLEPLRSLLNRIPESIPEAWLIAGAVFFLLILMTLFSIAMALIRYHGYRLERDEDRYRLQAGLITQREQGLRQHRIQHVRLSQSLIARLFRRHHLTCHQMGMIAPDQADGAGNSLMAPALTPVEQRRLLAHLYPTLPWHDLRFSGVSWRYMLPRAAFWGTVWLALMVAGLSDDMTAWILASGPAIPALVALNWRRQGWCLNGDHLILRGGLFGCHYSILAGFRSQTLRIHQTPLQRRARLANLSIRLGSGRFLLPFIHWHTAETLTDGLLYRMETSRAPWL